MYILPSEYKKYRNAMILNLFRLIVVLKLCIVFATFIVAYATWLDRTVKVFQERAFPRITHIEQLL